MKTYKNVKSVGVLTVILTIVFSIMLPAVALAKESETEPSQAVHPLRK